MHEEKTFLTYNQQLRKLRNEKNIDCEGTKDKTLLVRAGYFNIVNGYKDPFICDKDIMVNTYTYQEQHRLYMN